MNLPHLFEYLMMGRALGERDDHAHRQIGDKAGWGMVEIDIVDDAHAMA